MGHLMGGRLIGLSPQNKCLGNIATDLDHYAKVLQSYLDINHQWNPKEKAILEPMIGEIKGLREVGLLGSQVDSQNILNFFLICSSGFYSTAPWTTYPWTHPERYRLYSFFLL